MAKSYTEIYKFRLVQKGHEIKDLIKSNTFSPQNYILYPQEAEALYFNMKK
jgi:hypothetical protein